LFPSLFRTGFFSEGKNRLFFFPFFPGGLVSKAIDFLLGKPLSLVIRPQEFSIVMVPLPLIFCMRTKTPSSLFLERLDLPVFPSPLFFSKESTVFPPPPSTRLHPGRSPGLPKIFFFFPLLPPPQGRPLSLFSFFREYILFSFLVLTGPRRLPILFFPFWLFFVLV